MPLSVILPITILPAPMLHVTSWWYLFRILPQREILNSCPKHPEGREAIYKFQTASRLLCEYLVISQRNMIENIKQCTG